NVLACDSSIRAGGGDGPSAGARGLGIRRITLLPGEVVEIVARGTTSDGQGTLQICALVALIVIRVGGHGAELQSVVAPDLGQVVSKRGDGLLHDIVVAWFPVIRLRDAGICALHPAEGRHVLGVRAVDAANGSAKGGAEVCAGVGARQDGDVAPDPAGQRLV